MSNEYPPSAQRQDGWYPQGNTQDGAEEAIAAGQDTVICDQLSLLVDDPSAFTDLAYRAWKDQIVAHVDTVLKLDSRIHGQVRQLAEDATNESFANIFERMNKRSFKPDAKKNIKGLFYAAAMNVARDTLRKRILGTYSLSLIEDGEGANGDASLAVDPTDFVQTMMDQDTLEGAFHYLAAHTRPVLYEKYLSLFALHHIAGYTVQEAAEQLHVSYGAAKSWNARMLQKLRASQDIQEVDA